MQDFVFYNPVKIVFGRDATLRIGEETSRYARNVMLLYGGGSARANGIYDKVCASLTDSGVDWTERGGVRPNPVLSFVRDSIRVFREKGLDGIVAVGGGSVIDTAKTIAAGVMYDGDPWDFFIEKATPVRAVPITVVLTLPAAASEMNCGAVITNELTLQKYHFISEQVFPKVSILDPVNTFTVPRDYSMFGAIDAIIHLLEGYFNCIETDMPVQDPYVEGLVRSIMRSADKIYTSPKDYKARADLMWAATLALNGSASAGIGPTGFPMHMIEHSLSALYDVPHGAGLAIVSLAWMKYAYKERKNRFTRFAEKIFDISDGEGEGVALEGITALERWYKSVSAPVRLADIGVSREEIALISENAYMTSVQWGLDGRYTRETIADILELAA
ncbi:MAG: iron-containing alcohol dehydrogenase [Candidatus Omnitrophica bacterium]|nr:iron-containing alcohol dehydrogenase [Candidatus Omnitrophota bacterium]MDD5488013.1 iron-containing alcohol dehydrogenase [Candidatus Omnitrophota bacterium]